MLYPAELRAPVGLLAAAALIVIPVAAARSQAEPSIVADAPIAASVAGDTVRLSDGRTARLAGILVPESVLGDAAELMRAWLGRGPTLVEHDPRPLDRHGRLRVTLRRGDGTAQGELVRAGLAVVNPAGDVAGPSLEAWLRDERLARAGRVGLWRGRDLGPFDAAHVPARDGGFVLIEGRILRVARAREFVYANFGADLRTDVTLRAPAQPSGAAARSGLDLRVLEGKRVLARGFVVENNGPMIEITHRLQVEVLP